MQLRPTLAATIASDEEARQFLKFPVLGSPKIDGMRILTPAGMGAVSRTLKPVPNHNVRGLLSNSKWEDLDGEAVSGGYLDPRVFLKTMSALRTESGAPEFTFWVFDTFATGALSLPFESRLRLVEERLKDAPSFIKALPHKHLFGLEELLEYEYDCLQKGFEGAMVRDPKGRYKFGRSTEREGILFKIKRGQLQNGDAEIIGFNERMHNENEATIDRMGLQRRSSHKENMVGRGDLGSFNVRDIDTGFEFSVGTGVEGLIDDAFRKRVWDNKEAYLGKVIRYEWFKYGAYDKPRFPKMVCFRDKEDIG